MALRYCFEQSSVVGMLINSKARDLAVIDTDGIDSAKIKVTLYVLYISTAGG